MQVILKDSIIEKIRRAIPNAESIQREIERIELDKAESEEFARLVRLSTLGIPCRAAAHNHVQYMGTTIRLELDK